MGELFFGGGAAWFSVPAILGTAFFAIRALMLLIGGGGDMSPDLHADIGHGGLEGDLHSDSGHDFQVLSVQSIASFLMGFGWGGLGMLKGSNFHGAAVGVVAVGCGVGMVWLLGLLLKGMADLQSSGNIAIAQAMGHEGDVYVTVPGQSEGRGQVRLTIHSQQKIYNAVTGGEDLPSGTRVRVVKVNEDNTVTVARA